MSEFLQEGGTFQQSFSRYAPPLHTFYTTHSNHKTSEQAGDLQCINCSTLRQNILSLGVGSGGGVGWVGGYIKTKILDGFDSEREERVLYNLTD